MVGAIPPERSSPVSMLSRKPSVGVDVAIVGAPRGPRTATATLEAAITIPRTRPAAARRKAPYHPSAARDTLLKGTRMRRDHWPMQIRGQLCGQQLGAFDAGVRGRAGRLYGQRPVPSPGQSPGQSPEPGRGLSAAVRQDHVAHR
jgi:hypothetical protein